MTLVDTNRFGAARAELWEALAPVLPDRVYAYAPAPAAAPVAPAIWIARHDSYVDGPILVAAFTVTAVVDGATHAAQRMLDELVSGIWAASTAFAGLRFESHTWTSLAVSGDVTLLAADCQIAVTTGTHDFCAPVPHTAQIPPTNGGP